MHRAQKAMQEITKGNKEFIVIKKTGQLNMAQTVHGDTKAYPRETINNVEQCMSPTDVWHVGGAVQGVGKPTTSSKSVVL